MAASVSQLVCVQISEIIAIMWRRRNRLKDQNVQIINFTKINQNEKETDAKKNVNIEYNCVSIVSQCSFLACARLPKKYQSSNSTDEINKNNRN